MPACYNVRLSDNLEHRISDNMGTGRNPLESCCNIVQLGPSPNPKPKYSVLDQR